MMPGRPSRRHSCDRNGQGFAGPFPKQTRREKRMDQGVVVQRGIREWDETYAKQPDSWFFGREPSDLARQAYKYWKEIHCDRTARVLDFGCGEGRDSVYLASRGFAVTAIDGAKSAIAKA